MQRAHYTQRIAPSAKNSKHNNTNNSNKGNNRNAKTVAVAASPSTRTPGTATSHAPLTVIGGPQQEGGETHVIAAKVKGAAGVAVTEEATLSATRGSSSSSQFWAGALARLPIATTSSAGRGAASATITAAAAPAEAASLLVVAAPMIPMLTSVHGVTIRGYPPPSSSSSFVNNYGVGAAVAEEVSVAQWEGCVGACLDLLRRNRTATPAAAAEVEPRTTATTTVAANKKKNSSNLSPPYHRYEQQQQQQRHPSPLTVLNINTSTSEDDAWNDARHLNMPILRHLTSDKHTTTAVALIPSSLQILRIACNRYDESADIGALLRHCEHLQELSLTHCGLTSVKLLCGSRLRKVDLSNCHALASLEGLCDGRNNPLLETLNICNTAIRSLRPLWDHSSSSSSSGSDHTGTVTNDSNININNNKKKSVSAKQNNSSSNSGSNLKTIAICGCRSLLTLEGIEGFPQLEVLNASNGDISSLRPLYGCCPQLKMLLVRSCRDLTSLEGIQGHTRLEHVDVSRTAITSIRPLRKSHAYLKTITVNRCQELRSLEGLEKHRALEEVSASESAVSSLLPLSECRALRRIFLYCCSALTSLAGLEDHAHLSLVDAESTAITSLRALTVGCPSLTSVSVCDCPRLTDVADCMKKLPKGTDVRLF